MLTLGQFNTARHEGLSAVLQELPGLPPSALHMVTTPGTDRAFFADATFEPATWEFALHARGTFPRDVLAISEVVSRHCSPKHGLQPLTVDILPGWQWQAIASAELRWVRGRWRPGSECHLSATLTLLCPDPYGYAIHDEQWSWNTPGPHAIYRWATTNSHPTIEIEGALTAAQSITIDLAGQSLTITGPLSPGETLRLDYDAMNFGIWSGPVKTASAVGRLSTFERLTLPARGDTTISAATTGRLDQLRLHANNRRI